MRVDAPLAGEPLQREALATQPELGLDPASAFEPSLGTDDALAAPDLSGPAAAEPSAQAPIAAPASKVARHAVRVRSTNDDADAEETSYEPARSVPLQPLLDRLDTMLHESLTPPTAPSALPAAEPAPTPKPSAPRARTPEGLPDNPY
jgi:hypothetical protein